jgi:hypothetical protein
MAYDTREADALLRGGFGQFGGGDSSKRAAAARELVDCALKVAEQAGFTLTPDKTGEAISLSVQAIRGCVWLQSGSTGVTVGFDAGKRGSLMPDVPIEFESATGEWVGRERDGYIVPTPGEPYSRRSAVAVVAESVIEAFRKLDGA